jgi:hypothetical protein
MCRLSLLLIAAIAVASISIQPAAGQFPIPKIKLPTIPKKDTPATPTQPDTVSPSSDAGRSTPAQSGKVRGKPVPGAKITFSNNPDGSNPRTSFTSSEFIYGRLDLGGKTVYDAFGLKNLGDAKFYYINYDLRIWKPDEKPWDDWGGRNFTLVTKEDAQKTYWNFDVLPDPTKVSTLKSAIEDELEYYKGVAGIYSKWYNDASARSTFPQNGTYTIDVTLYGNSYDDWGKPTGESEKYPTVSATFAFQFSGTDGQTLIANAKKAGENLEAARNRRGMLRAMPDWWAKGATPPEPKLAPARLVPMIKSYIGQWNLTYLKHMIYPFKGSVWAVETNDLGIPRYRRVTSAIYIIYKDPKDDACKLGYLEMIENYAGGGTYAAPHLTGISDVRHIECSVVK